MSDLHDVSPTPPTTRPTTRPASRPTDERPLPWEHWSKDRRQWTALGAAAGLVVLGAIVGLLSLWS
jgi:hypothetical protein